MRDDPVVIALVARVRDGDQTAWDEVVERYSPLVWSICVRYRLSRQDTDDVGQSVWLLLVEQIGSLREPAALPGWLATTTRRECLRILRAARRHDAAGLPAEDQMPADPAAVMVEDEVIVAERDAALRAAFAELPAAAAISYCRCWSAIRRARTRRSARRCRCQWAASARCAPAAWSGCAARRT